MYFEFHCTKCTGLRKFPFTWHTMKSSYLIGVCTDTYVFYQSVLEKRPIGQVYRKGRNVTSHHVTDTSGLCDYPFNSCIAVHGNLPGKHSWHELSLEKELNT